MLRALRGRSWGIESAPVRTLEREVADYCGVRFALAVDSGTSALMLGLVAAGVGPETEVITSALSFAATPMAVAALGATPVFCDVRADTGTIDPGQIEGLITERTRALLPVAVHGVYCDTDRLAEIAERYGLAVVCDVCQAIGSRDERGRAAGTGGDSAALSLNTSKPFQAGEGGVYLSDDEELYVAARRYACFGEDRVTLREDETRAYWSRYVGINARLHPLAAALATSQLRRVGGYIERGRRNLGYLADALADIPGLRMLAGPPGCEVTPWHPRIVLDPAEYGWTSSGVEYRDRVIAALRGRGLPVETWQRHALPANPAFRRRLTAWSPGLPEAPLEPWEPAAFPVVSHLLDNSLTVGMYPYPLYVQSERVMRHYAWAFRATFDRMDAVLSEPYRAVSLASPPLPGEL